VRERHFQNTCRDADMTDVSDHQGRFHGQLIGLVAGPFLAAFGVLLILVAALIPVARGLVVGGILLALIGGLAYWQSSRRNAASRRIERPGA
jgi:hypothetical protein